MNTKLELQDTRAFVPSELLKAIVKHGVRTLRNVPMNSCETEGKYQAAIEDVFDRICDQIRDIMEDNDKAVTFATKGLDEARFRLVRAAAISFAPAKPPLPNAMADFFGEFAGNYQVLRREFDLD